LGDADSKRVAGSAASVQLPAEVRRRRPVEPGQAHRAEAPRRWPEWMRGVHETPQTFHGLDAPDGSGFAAVRACRRATPVITGRLESDRQLHGPQADLPAVTVGDGGAATGPLVWGRAAAHFGPKRRAQAVVATWPAHILVRSPSERFPHRFAAGRRGAFSATPPAHIFPLCRRRRGLLQCPSPTLKPNNEDLSAPRPGTRAVRVRPLVAV
jgi:hypothetical protein